MTTSQIKTNISQQELRIAKSLLESPGWDFGTTIIEPIENQSIESATKEFIRTLPINERTKLRELVDWVLEYENNDKRAYA
jgi:hypothetical protein